uniref:Uncharacterized protein n=1 Tax=Ditylenchus dipsaci TaxID=166011 RepID=A0A915E6Q6_9BILA
MDDLDDLSDLEVDSNDDASGDELGFHSSDSDLDGDDLGDEQQNMADVLLGKDGTHWYTEPPQLRQIPRHQALRQQAGLPPIARNNQTAQEVFFKLFDREMLEYLQTATNQRGDLICVLITIEKL